MKRIKLKHGTARVDENISNKTIEALNKISEILINMKKEIIFTHFWVSGFGWENTIYHPSDFEEVIEAGKNDEGVIFYANFDKNKKTHLLKGYYKPKN